MSTPGGSEASIQGKRECPRSAESWEITTRRHALAAKKLVNSYPDAILTGLSLQSDRLRAMSIDEIRQVDWPI